MNDYNQNPLYNMASQQKQQLINNGIEYNNNQYPDFTDQDNQNKYNQEIYVHNSLNEPIMTSLTRDLNRIYAKLKVVALPVSSEQKHKELKQWDLWGPFIICLLLGIILCFTSKKKFGISFFYDIYHYVDRGYDHNYEFFFIRREIDFNAMYMSFGILHFSFGGRFTY